MINGFIHRNEGSNFILNQKRITLRNYLWFVFKNKLYKMKKNFFSRNPRSCFFRILFASSICFIFIRLIFFQFKGPLLPNFININNKEILSESSNKLLNFTIAFSNAQKNYQMEKPLFEPCKGKQIKLLVLIMSRRETLYKRMGIRKSWAKDVVVYPFEICY